MRRKPLAIRRRSVSPKAHADTGVPAIDVLVGRD